METVNTRLVGRKHRRSRLTLGVREQVLVKEERAGDILEAQLSIYFTVLLTSQESNSP